MNISQHSFVPLGFITHGAYIDELKLTPLTQTGCSVLTPCSFANCIIFFSLSGSSSIGGVFRTFNLLAQPPLLDKLVGLSSSLTYPYLHFISDVVESQVFTISFLNQLPTFGLVTCVMFKV